MLDDDGRVGAQAASLTGRLTLDPKRADLMLPLSGSYRSATGFSQHPDQHRSERPILLAVDQRLGEGAALREAPPGSPADMSGPHGVHDVRRDPEPL